MVHLQTKESGKTVTQFFKHFKPADTSPEEKERAKLLAARSLAQARRALGLPEGRRARRGASKLSPGLAMRR